jgi:serine/threonine protein kinase/Tfp pilus assembly protein PilF
MERAMFSGGNCPKECDLQALAAGKSGGDTSLIAQHLSDCPRCAAKFDAFLIGDGSLDETRREGSPDQQAASRKSLEAKGSQSAQLLSNRYRIGEFIAAGGMGEVHRAVDVIFDREVAVKRLLPTYRGDADAGGRFRREAAMTARLQHPGIPPMHDLGTLTNGDPFLAMKLISGKTLAQLLKERKDPSEDIPRLLSIFEQVCRAVGYAHAKGVIHRDLKPANVMVGEFGEVQVMDWGLAKEVGGAETLRATPSEALTDPQQRTMDGAIMGTLAYMAPEQARGEISTLDARADVFALGAILLQILTGHGLYDGKNRIEILVEVLEDAKQGKFDPAIERLKASGIDADLVEITTTCLAFDRSQRPSDGNQIADAIAAHAARVEERLRKTESDRVAAEARRRVTLYAATTVAGVLLLGIIGTGYGLWHAEQKRLEAVKAETKAAEKRREAERLAEEKSALAEQNASLFKDARTEADKAVKLSRFLIETFQASDPLGQGGASFFIPRGNGGTMRAREILDNGAKRVQTDPELREYPLAKAAVMDAIGDVYRQLALFEEAEPLLSEALRIRRELLPDDHIDLSTSCHNMAWYYHERGNFPASEPLYREALAIRRKIPGEQGRILVAYSLHNLGWMLANANRIEDAVPLFEESMAIREKAFDSPHREIAFGRAAMAFCRVEQSRYAEAIPLMTAAVEELSKLEDSAGTTEAASQFVIGIATRETVGSAFAEPMLKRSLAAVESTYGKENIYAGLARYELARTQLQLGKDAEAIANLEFALGIARSKVQLQHPRISMLIDTYGKWLARHGEKEKAAAICLEFLEAQRNFFTDDHEFAARALLTYANVMRIAGDMRAVPDAKRAIEAGRERTDWPIEVQLELRSALAMTLLDAEVDLDDSDRYWAEIIHSVDQLPEPINEKFLIRRALARIRRVDILTLQRKFDEGRARIAEALLDSPKTPKYGIDLVDEAREAHAKLELTSGHPTAAIDLIAARRSSYAKDGAMLFSLALDLGKCGDACMTSEEGSLDLRAESIKRCRALACETLSQSIAAGRKIRKGDHKRAEFASMLQVPEFRKIVGLPPLEAGASEPMPSESQSNPYD